MEVWFVYPCRDQTNPDIFPNQAKNLRDYMCIIPNQKMYFRRQKSLDLRNFNSYVYARNSLPRLGDALFQKISLRVNFLMNTCVDSFSLLLIFYKAMQ